MVSGKARRLSTETESRQIAKEKLRQFESARVRGCESFLPTKTPIADVLDDYIKRIRSIKSPKAAQAEIYYLREAFGPVCEGLRLTSRKLSAKTKKRPPKPGQDRRRKGPVIEAQHFEAITTAQISAFIDGHLANRGLKPRTGNRLREALSALFSWAMSQRGIRMRGGENPVKAVAKYKQDAAEISFLQLNEIEEQLDTLSGNVKLQAMVATLIFAGLRREELLWLTPDDVDWASGSYGLLRIRAKTVNDESWQPKTKKNRAVPISSRLRTYLDKWRLKGLKGTWLFPNGQGNRYDPDNFSRRLRRANAAKGLSWTNLHYRHTFGSQLAMKGESLYKIATLMGNSPEICRLHYAALLTDSLVESVEFGRGSVKTPPHPVSA
jgi:integrase